jgi:hypothetical protein
LKYFALFILICLQFKFKHHYFSYLFDLLFETERNHLKFIFVEYLCFINLFVCISFSIIFRFYSRLFYRRVELRLVLLQILGLDVLPRHFSVGWRCRCQLVDNVQNSSATLKVTVFEFV